MSWLIDRVTHPDGRSGRTGDVVRTKIVRWVALVVTAVLVAAGCTDDDGFHRSAGTIPPGSTVRGAGDTYQAVIRRDAAGVPHITGRSFADVTFGQGWASGEDRTCDLADQVLKVTSQRARWLGAGKDDANIDSDVAWKAIGIADIAAADWAKADHEVRDLMTAYTDGWNAHLADVGSGGVANWCAGAPWVRPLEPVEIYTYARSIALQASSGAVADMLAGAAPPTGSTPAAPPAGTPASLAVDTRPAMASNGWAIGSQRSTDGGGMLVGNPHFPWEGELRFWEVHLTVPGQLNIYGVQLSGLPGIGIGFTERFGWTHTVSAGNRFTAYRLNLVKGDPTSYVYGNTTRRIQPTDVAIQVRGADGTVTEQHRTGWRSHYGPMLDFPGVGWTDTTAITLRDANIDDDEFIEQYLRMTKAKTLDDLIAANRDVTGVPLFNTIATSADGRAWYADTSATPALSDEAIAKYEGLLKSDPLVKAAADNGAVLLDGSDPTFEWQVRKGARDPGLVPFDQMPSTTRRDYVFNANDSYWLSNAHAPLTGDYSPLHGRADVAQSFRTRENALVLDDTSPSGPAGEDGRFTLDELAHAALLNRGFTAGELLDDVVARCEAAPPGGVRVDALAGDDGAAALPAATVDVAPACSVLAGWDGIYDLDRTGPVLWREFLDSYDGAERSGDGDLWATKFDPADPVGTPGGLAPAPAGQPDPVLTHLARAVQVLAAGGLAVDVRLGDVQAARRNDRLVPVHGGDEVDGTTNVVTYGRGWSTLDPTLTGIQRQAVAPGADLAKVTDADGRVTTGYRVNYGTSFLFALSYEPDGPHAKAFLTYGNTADRSAPEYTAATEAFGAKRWRDLAFTERDVAKATRYTTVVRG